MLFLTKLIFFRKQNQKKFQRRSHKRPQDKPTKTLKAFCSWLRVYISFGAKANSSQRRESQSSGKIFTCDKWLIKFPAQPRRWRRKKWNARRAKSGASFVSSLQLSNWKTKRCALVRTKSGFWELFLSRSLLRTFLRGAFFGGPAAARTNSGHFSSECRQAATQLEPHFLPLCFNPDIIWSARCARAFCARHYPIVCESGYLLINTRSQCVWVCALCTNIN